jgi:hypothetical protein
MGQIIVMADWKQSHPGLHRCEPVMPVFPWEWALWWWGLW